MNNKEEENGTAGVPSPYYKPKVPVLSGAN